MDTYGHDPAMQQPAATEIDATLTDANPSLL
jgi:hypothetical protein